MSNRKNHPYKPGELEVILRQAPTADNIRWMSLLLDRSEDAVEIVYKIAYQIGPFGIDDGVQTKKILAAKPQ